jgi:hypothetical protein
MVTSSAVAAFLDQVNARNVTDHLAPADLAQLQQLGLLRMLSTAELQQVEQEVEQLNLQQSAIAAESDERARAAASVAQDVRKSHSILFHLEGVDAEHATLERLEQEQAALRNLDADLLKRQQAFAQLLVQKALLDTVSAYDGGYIGITTAGRMALRDLQVRLYRVGDQDFSRYWTAASTVDADLHRIADGGAQIVPLLAAQLREVEHSYLWAVAIGMVKAAPDPSQQVPRFLDAYLGTEHLSDNVENRLMAAEIVSFLPRDPRQGLGDLQEVADLLRHHGVAEEAVLGAAAILLMGQRADGTYALDPLTNFLTETASVEAAALLAIVNQPFDALSAKFNALRSLFASWGYAASEDTELSSAYLTVSDLPIESVAPKLAILSRGLAGYLQYPLVGSAILASIPVLEANETLNLLEKAYGILGTRTGPMSQAEIISLAVRTIHGIQVASVDALDPTARVVPAAPGFSYLNAPPRLWLPVFISHNMYYATFSGIGGVHPGHVHSWGGGGWGGGGFVG